MKKKEKCNDDEHKWLVNYLPCIVFVIMAVGFLLGVIVMQMQIASIEGAKAGCWGVVNQQQNVIDQLSEEVSKKSTYEVKNTTYEKPDKIIVATDDLSYTIAMPCLYSDELSPCYYSVNSSQIESLYQSDKKCTNMKQAVICMVKR